MKKKIPLEKAIIQDLNRNIEHLETRKFFWFVLFLVALAGFLLTLYLLNKNLSLITVVTNPIIKDNNKSFTIDELSEKCHSTQLAKKYGEDEWSVFVSICQGEYCKYDYVKLSDCLN
jgi:hypothetical protein